MGYLIALIIVKVHPRYLRSHHRETETTEIVLVITRYEWKSFRIGLDTDMFERAGQQWGPQSVRHVKVQPSLALKH